jgi:hypothetical protein
MFSKQRMQRMRSERVRNMSLAGNLQELLQKSDTITGILKDQKDILDSRYKTSEASLIKVIERRKGTMAISRTTQAAHRRAESDADGHRKPDRCIDGPEGADQS